MMKRKKENVKLGYVTSKLQETGVYLFLECFFISGVKNTTINNLDIPTFVVINREKRYFLVINRETRQLRLLIVNFRCLFVRSFVRSFIQL